MTANDPSSDLDWESIRAAYENRLLPVGQIIKQFGVSKDRLYRRVHKYGWVQRRQMIDAPSKTPLKTPEAFLPTATTLEKRAALAARLFHALEERILAIEEESLDHDATHSERDAKALTAMARALELLSDMLESASPPPTDKTRDQGGSEEEMDDDEFRNLLEERLNRLQAGSQDS